VCLACEDLVLFYGYVGVFIVVAVVTRSLRVLLPQLLCSSSCVSCMLRCSVGLWLCWFFYSGICCEAFIVSVIAATVV